MAFGWINRRAWATKKATSQGRGGRGRRTKISMSTMNKHKRRNYKAYRGQGK
jgi:hypothetical protein